MKMINLFQHKPMELIYLINSYRARTYTNGILIAECNYFDGFSYKQIALPVDRSISILYCCGSCARLITKIQLIINN